METKEMIVRIKLLANDILDYSMGSYFGIKADNMDVINLWQEYADIRDLITKQNPQDRDDYIEVRVPEPYIADKDSFYQEGTLIFRPEHFTGIRLAVEKMLCSLMLDRKETKIYRELAKEG